MNLHTIGGVDLRQFGALLPPGRLPDGRPMRTALLLVSPDNLPPLLAALESAAVLGIVLLNEPGFELAGMVFLRRRARIPHGKCSIEVHAVEGSFVPQQLASLAQATALGLATPPQKALRLILPN